MRYIIGFLIMSFTPCYNGLRKHYVIMSNAFRVRHHGKYRERNEKRYTLANIKSSSSLMNINWE